MPSPSSSLATQRPDLAESFMEFDLEADAQGFIAHRVLPMANVMAQAGNFGIIPLEELLQERDTKRAPGSGYARGNWKFEPATYACEEHGAEEPVDDREAKMYAEYFDAERISASRAFSSVLRNAEARVASAVFNATTWTATTVTNEWDDATNAVPITDVEAAVQAIYDASGLWANALVINRKVFRNLRNCDSVIARINSAGAGVISRPADVTTQMLAEVFDLPNILVAGGTYNSATEGQAASPAQIWSGEYAMICKIATGQDFREPCLGRTFHWGDDGSSVDGTFESYRDETVRGDVIRVRHDVDEVILYTAAAHLLDNITT